MELIILIVVLALAVAGGILIVSNLGIIVVLVALVVMGTAAYLLFGITVLLPLAYMREWYDRLPDQTRLRLEASVRWTARGVIVALVIWVIVEYFLMRAAM